MSRQISFLARSAICICVLFFALSSCVLAVNPDGYYKFGDKLAVRVLNGESVINLPGMTISQDGGKLVIATTGAAQGIVWHEADYAGMENSSFQRIELNPGTCDDYGKMFNEGDATKYYPFPGGIKVYYDGIYSDSPMVYFGDSDTELLSDGGCYRLARVCYSTMFITGADHAADQGPDVTTLTLYQPRDGILGAATATDVKNLQQLRETTYQKLVADKAAFQNLAGVTNQIHQLNGLQNVPVQWFGKSGKFFGRWSNTNDLQNVGTAPAGEIGYSDATGIVKSLRAANNAGDVWFGFAATSWAQFQAKQDWNNWTDSWREEVQTGSHTEQVYVLGIPWGTEDLPTYGYVHHNEPHNDKVGSPYQVMANNPRGYIFTICRNDAGQFQAKFLQTVNGQATWSDSVPPGINTLLFCADF